jgi:Cu+-exporting ATPase
MSVVVATSRAAREGILFRDAAALQALGEVDVLVLDKTGTLTEGRPTLVDVVPAEGFERAEILRCAAAAEVGSEHPVASAIVTAARAETLPLADAERFESVAGEGVRAVVEGRCVTLGNARWLARNGVTTELLEPEARRHAERGATAIFVAIGESLAGLIVVTDPLRSGAREALAKLRALDVELHMATGDRRATAESLAAEVAIGHVFAEASPAAKAESVRDLRSAGRRIAMVGDGVNDAPALALADVGVAMGAGTDVAKQVAAVTLVRDDLDALVRAVALARATMANVRQNLAFALGYNALCVPVAAGALAPLTGLALSPMLAALAMTFSSLSVIANALRLRAQRLD